MNPDDFKKYSNIPVIHFECDDGWENLLHIAEKYNLAVAQPSVSNRILNYNFMYKKENYIFRIVSFLDEISAI